MVKCGTGGAVKDAEICERPTNIDTDPECALRRLQSVRLTPRAFFGHGHGTLLFCILEHLYYIPELVRWIVNAESVTGDPKFGGRPSNASTHGISTLYSLDQNCWHPAFGLSSTREISDGPNADQGFMAHRASGGGQR